MKSSEFKKILKPLIKQTVREVILEEGLLSNIVSEVARGLHGNLVVEASSPTPGHSPEEPGLKKQEQELEKRRQERIRRLNESAKSNLGADVFKGTKEIAEPNGSGPLTGVSSGDSGIDISDIERLSNGKWKRLI